MVIVKKDRDMKLVTTNSGGNHLVSKPNYHTTKWFSENLKGIERCKNGQIVVFRSIRSRHQ